MNIQPLKPNQYNLGILIIDEPIISEFLESALIYAGCFTVIFDNAKDALLYFQNKHQKFDAIIIDSKLCETLYGSPNETSMVEQFLSVKEIPILIWGQEIDETKSNSNKKQNCHYLNKSQNEVLKRIGFWLHDINTKKNTKIELSNIYQLIYISNATPSLSEQDLIDILNVSRKFNQEHTITGVLLYQNGYFIQVLEGELKVISDLFHNHICQDKRHTKVVSFYHSYVKERQFPNWTMGFYDSSFLEKETDANKIHVKDFLNEKIIEVQKLLTIFKFF